MTMIECPKCTSMVSDKALKCPSCGAELNNESTPVEESTPEPITCEECGEILDAEAIACPKCGCPAEKNEDEAPQSEQESQLTEDSKNSKPKIKDLSRKQIVIAAVAAMVVILAGFGIKAGLDAKAVSDYKANLEAAASSMLDGAVAAESASSMIHDVWYNTIYQKPNKDTDKYTKASGSSYKYNSDFNTSLRNYMSSSSYLALAGTISDSQTKVNNYMKQLQNPPKGYEEAHQSIKALYDAYSDITNCALNPSGTLVTYTQTINSADSEFIKKYDAVKLYL